MKRVQFRWPYCHIRSLMSLASQPFFTCSWGEWATLEWLRLGEGKLSLRSHRPPSPAFACTIGWGHPILRAQEPLKALYCIYCKLYSASQNYLQPNHHKGFVFFNHSFALYIYLELFLERFSKLSCKIILNWIQLKNCVFI